VIEPKNSGFCKLCNRKAVLVKSHIFPKFLYKRFAANQDRGGAFNDLGQLKRHNRQLRERWCCKECEKKFGETEAADFLNLIQKADQQEYKYNSEIFRFVVSISWRWMLYEKEKSDNTEKVESLLKPALKRWRAYLRGDRKDIGKFTQHGFIYRSQQGDVPWEAMMGAQVFYDEKMVFFRIGPLTVFGLLDKRPMESSEAQRLSETQLDLNGGTLQVLEKLKVNHALTDSMCRILNQSEQWCIARSKKMPNPR